MLLHCTTSLAMIIASVTLYYIAKYLNCTVENLVNIFGFSTILFFAFCKNS